MCIRQNAARPPHNHDYESRAGSSVICLRTFPARRAAAVSFLFLTRWGLAGVAAHRARALHTTIRWSSVAAGLGASFTQTRPAPHSLHRASGTLIRCAHLVSRGLQARSHRCDSAKLRPRSLTSTSFPQHLLLRPALPPTGTSFDRRVVTSSGSRPAADHRERGTAGCHAASPTGSSAAAGPTRRSQSSFGLCCRG